MTRRLNVTKLLGAVAISAMLLGLPSASNPFMPQAMADVQVL
jgi:hypothetical protein